jgi:hypothetical protein
MLTEIVVILDRSGSMEQGRSDHEGGLRSFIRDQKDGEGDVRFTLIQFDTHNPCEVVYDGVPAADVGEIKLIPRGGTPLLDAIGKAMAHIESRELPKADFNIVMVVTDGYENSSIEYNRGTIKELVKRKEAEGWQWLFLGANIDAFQEAGSIGIRAATAANYAPTSAGIKAAYAFNRSNVCQAREEFTSGGLSAAASCLAYSDTQRAAMSGDTHSPDKEPPDGTVSSSGDSQPDQKATG